MSGASLVYVADLSKSPVGSVIYHSADYWATDVRTHCGRWLFTDSDQELMIPVRRDIAEAIGRLCSVCERRAREEAKS